MRDGTVTWRVELPLSWGGRWDPSWLPTDNTESWRGIYAAEDRAGAVFAGGGGGRKWATLAGAVAPFAVVLEQYRMQLRAAEDAAAACPVAADRHLAALAVPAGLVPPRCTAAPGRWRVCVLDGGAPALVGVADSWAAAEGVVSAEQVLAPARVCWAEPVAARAAPTASAGPVWRPRVDTALRLRAFAAEEAIRALCAAAATGHTGPDVVDSALLCRLGVVVHRMILEYRTLFRDVWTDLEACVEADRHDADAAATLLADREPDVQPWRHVVLQDGSVQLVGEYADRASAVASVAAHRAVDDRSVRWAEPRRG